MGLLDKCHNYTDAEDVRSMGLYPYFRPISSEQDAEVVMDGKRVLMLGSNSYLGLTNDPRVKEAAIEAIRRFGTGCAGSRFLNGTLDIHIELEEKLARFVGKEAALLYSTGFMVNQGVISTLVGRGDYVFTDRLDHASIVDGARLAFGRALRFRHNDMDELEQRLSSCPREAGKLIVVDGVFSMDGDIARLPEIVELAERYNAEVMVDDAHAIGVLGPNGEGTAAHFGLTDRVALIMGTFSKSLASIGGFVAGDRVVIDYLKHHSRALIFSASLPPASVAAVSCALDILISEPERRENLWRNTHFMQSELRRLGFDVGNTETPIIPVVVGDMLTCFKMCRMLQDEGVFVNPVVPPAVEPNRCLIRVSFMATHTIEELSFAVKKFEYVGKKLGVIK
ncbi:aminotransferase class I/II-fold pyridoxal phosphate-dependent enzyme [bacterium]|nr:aminotransferase class I/II-fold pyridoxal phosphate-dependent enzyme [bacterium]